MTSHLIYGGVILFSGLNCASTSLKYEGDLTELFCGLFLGRSYSLLLDSAGGPQHLCKLSMIAADPLLTITVKNNIIEIDGLEKKTFFSDDPFQAIRQYWLELKTAIDPQNCPGLGFYGALAYDAGRYIEHLPNTCKDDLSTPDIVFFLPKTVLRFDHEQRMMTVTKVSVNGEQDRELGELLKKIDRPEKARHSQIEQIESAGIPRPCMDRHDFASRTKRIIDYINAGDVFQVNFSQRFVSDFGGSTWDLYMKMRSINPSPFFAYFDTGAMQLLCGSPERLVSMNGMKLQTRPIGGTCRRGASVAEDDTLARGLLADPKERAEHVMLVDLERNDLGKSCKLGSVMVDEFMVIEQYSHVNHIVSNICGRLDDSLDGLDVVRGMFPGGTITGCPKVRCMEIIDESESVRRGFYTGSLGYIDISGNIDFNIVIRSIVIAKQHAYIQVGAGIVCDSKPYREFDETIEKAQAMFNALAMREKAPNV